MPSEASSFFDLQSAPLGLFGGFAQSGGDQIRIELRGQPQALKGSADSTSSLNRRAVEWAQACSAASERLRQSLGGSPRLGDEPALIQITQSSPLAASARVALEPVVNQALRWAESAPLLALARRARSTERLGRAQQRLAAFHKGPEARLVDGSWRVIIPAMNRTDDLMARASSAWSVAEARQFLVMHETGHVEHQRDADAFNAYFGLDGLPAPAACALALLAGVSEPIAKSTLVFESACSTLMAEGYADAFACLALGEGLASKSIELARQAARMRIANAGTGDAEAAISDQDPLHDTSEALAALVEALEAGPERLELTPERLRALCLSSASAGLCRWVCALPARPNLHELQAAFYAKCEGLAQRDEVGEPRGFFETLKSAEASPLGASLSRLNWAQARREELDSSESPSDDRSARVALSLMMDLANGVGAPRSLTARSASTQNAPLSQTPQPLLRVSAEPATRFERFLIASARGARRLTLLSRSVKDNASASIPQFLIGSRAADWMSACDQASALWASCPGSPRSAPIQAEVTQASVLAPAATLVTKAALGMAIELCGAWRQIKNFLCHPVPLPEPLASAPLPIQAPPPLDAAGLSERRLSHRLRDLRLGAVAYALPSLFDPRPPEPETPLAPLLVSVRVVFPANREAESALRQMMSHGALIDPQELRVFIALHEASHATLALQSPAAGDHFGLSLASDSTAQSLRALLWPPALPECDRREEAAQGMTELFGEFEAVARSVFMESHADCLATLTQSQTDAQACSRLAQSWIQIRSSFIDADPERFDSPQGSMLTHDTREALTELAELCSAHGSGPLALPEGGTHELASRCALAGTARWICQMASQEPPGLLTQALRHKLDFLARVSPAASSFTEHQRESVLAAEWAGPLSRPVGPGCGVDEARLAKGVELLGPLHRDFGLPRGPARGSFHQPPSNPKPAFMAGSRVATLSQLVKEAADSLRAPSKATAPKPASSRLF